MTYNNLTIALLLIISCVYTERIYQEHTDAMCQKIQFLSMNNHEQDYKNWKSLISKCNDDNNFLSSNSRRLLRIYSKEKHRKTSKSHSNNKDDSLPYSTDNKKYKKKHSDHSSSASGQRPISSSNTKS
eukprot:967212_1